jgi:hypothetical protein
MTKQKPLPKPTVDTLGSPDGETTEQTVRAVLCNPIYAGMGPFPAVVSDEVWVAAAVKAIKEEGLEQWLVNMLACLRATLPKELFSGTEQ